jgi:hypothetical protein
VKCLETDSSGRQLIGSRNFRIEQVSYEGCQSSIGRKGLDCSRCDRSFLETILKGIIFLHLSKLLQVPSLWRTITAGSGPSDYEPSRTITEWLLAVLEFAVPVRASRFIVVCSDPLVSRRILAARCFVHLCSVACRASSKWIPRRVPLTGKSLIVRECLTASRIGTTARKPDAIAAALHRPAHRS